MPTQVTFRLAQVTLPNPGDPSEALATAAGTGPTVTLQPNGDLIEAPIQEFPGRLPVKKGMQLAIDAGESLLATVNNSGQEFSYVYAPPLVDGSGARGSLESTGELLVAATIEPDADGDGFGDETQDACPTQGTTQGACDLTKPAVSGLKVNGAKVAYKLNEAATVTLKLEKKAPGRKVGSKCVKQTAKNKAKKACSRWRPVGKTFGGTGNAGANSVTLPKGKSLAAGTYRLTLTAVDAAGNKTVKSTTFVVGLKTKKGK